MDHYIDIRLLPDLEFLPTVLMNALFSKFHRALVKQGTGEIAVSFPKASKKPGECLRLHGKRDALARFMEYNWLQGMRDHIAITEVQRAPDSCTYRIIRRAQAKSNAERLRRRSIKKGWLTPEQAVEQIPLKNERRLSLPFLQLKSGSSEQHFRLFIDQSQELSEPQMGTFSSYGLSATGTVPWF